MTEDKIQQLKAIMPEVFTEGNRIDFDKLKLILGENVETEQELFGLSWAGKKDCFKVIQEPSIGTLKPIKDESINWKNTDNLFIEGDNLEVLKLLQKSYYNKVKMIYIDPPYNTGKEFIYPDRFQENLDTYLKYTGQIDEDGTRFTTNKETEGRFHSNWLNMMYPRLFLARNLLREDGVIFISIDNNEIDNLKKLCNEIFGEENFVECITWNKRIPKNDKGIGSIHEYILIYVKQSLLKHEFTMLKNGLNDIYKLLNNLKKKKIDLVEAESIIKKLYKKNNYDRGITLYNSLDDNYRLWGKINMSWPNSNTFGSRYEVLHPKTNKPVNIPDRGWRWKKETFDEAAGYKNDKYNNIIELHDGSFLCGKIWFDKDENTQPSSINYLEDVERYLLRSVLSLKSDGGIEVENLFDGKSYFPYPKPTFLLKILVQSIPINTNDIILDFFAGSVTTAHAVIDLNKTDGGNRKYIMVQLPEPCDEKSEAKKAGFETIADIGKERIRRVIKNIRTEQQELEKTIAIKKVELSELEAKVAAEPTLFETNGKAAEKIEKLKNHIEELAIQLANIEQTDLGFKVFKLDKSNFKVWDGDIGDDPKGAVLEGKMFEALDHILPDSTDVAILYEIILKAGYSLNVAMENLTLQGKTVYSINKGALLVCLEKQLTQAVLNAMAALSPREVVCLDAGFHDNIDADALKTNAVQTMQSHGVLSFKTI